MTVPGPVPGPVSGPGPRPPVRTSGGTAPARPTPVGGPLAPSVTGWLRGAADWIQAGGTADDRAAADRIAPRGSATADAQTPRAVIIGETNRGKSSLVNAILGAPGLSPVDAGVATSAYLLFRHGPEERAVARFGGGMADIAIPPSALASWATLQGEADPDLPPPRWIEVMLPTPVLRAVDLIDTPGVGGLVAAHAELAAEAAASASALLFVVDASAPFTSGELAFLAGVAQRVDTVHFVITKTDAYRGWRQIVDADRALLARHAPRFADAPFHPVSARLAQAADAQPDPAVAQVLRTQSGIDEVRRVLTVDVAARAALLADANRIRTALTVISGGLAKVAADRAALTAGAAQVDELKARREELVGRRRTGGRSWQVMLRAELQRARLELSGEVSRETREASTMFRGAIDSADTAELRALPLHIDAYAQAMGARAAARIADVMNRLAQRVLADLFRPEELAMLTATLVVRPPTPAEARPLEKAHSIDESITALGGASMGFALSHYALMPLGLVGLGVVLTPVSIVLGGAAAWFLIRSRKRVADRVHLKQWLGEVLGEAKVQLDQTIAAQFVEADQQLTLALDDALARQVAAVDEQIAQVDRALKLDTTERSARMRALDQRRDAALALAGSGDALLTRIRGTSPAVPPVTLPAGLLARLNAQPPVAPSPAQAAPSPAPPPQAAPPAAAPSPAPPPQAARPPDVRRVTTADGRQILIPDRLLRELRSRDQDG